MGSFKTLIDRLFGVLLIIDLFFMIVFVLIALYIVPVEFKPMITVLVVFFMVITLSLIALRALLNKLQFRMGFRNLLRHKGDTIIAILGFMIGTSIICSSMAIGDTMNNMIEDLIYEGYDLSDEYLFVQDGNGDRMYLNGSYSNRISDAVWALNENETLVDGVSWEVSESGSVIDHNTILFEPQMTLRAFGRESTNAFGGLYIDGKEVDYDLGMDEVYITESGADLLEAEVDHHLTISSGIIMKNYTVKGIVDSKGRAASFFNGDALFFSFLSIWTLFNITPDQDREYGKDRDWSGGHYNMLFVSNEGGRVDGGELCPDVIKELEEGAFTRIEHPQGEEAKLEFIDDKKTSVDEGMEGISTFTKMFLTLGSFTIIAGITLIINIFVMLSEERKEEMGISRAIGMKRGDLRLVYLFEGTLYSLLSSFVGVILGVVSGYGIIWGLQKIFDSMGVEMFDILGAYRVSPLSLVISFVAGFTITIGTTLFITRRISRLNIVSAIRSTPIPVKESKLIRSLQRMLDVYDELKHHGNDTSLAKAIEFLFTNTTIVGTIAILIGGLFAFWGISMETSWNTFMGLSMILIGFSMVLKHFLDQRITFNIAAILILLLWIVPIPMFSEYSGDLEMFILAGIFMVSSGVLLLVWNTDIILWVVERIITMIGISPASIKMAVSYPIKKRFRTGVTIFMFALIIFTITGMSMIVEIFNVNIDEFERSIGGGYDIIGISGVGINDIETTIQIEDPESYEDINWDRSVSLSMGILQMEAVDPFGDPSVAEWTIYQCAGVSDKFIEKNTYGFSDVKWDLIDEGGSKDHTDRLVWESLREGDFVIIDGSQSGSGGFGPPGGFGREVGEVITIQSIDGKNHTKTIIGFTEQFGISAVFMYNESAREEFGVTEKTIHLFKLDGVDDKDGFSNDLRRSMLKYMMYTVIIEEIVRDFLKVQNAFFDLFNAFLSLGLVVGIVGLGIVTLRSVYERRHEIGMMRAIGFKKRTVIWSFIGESAFIAGSGLTIGTLLGIVLGWILWRDGMKDAFPEFGVPWVKLLVIVGIALFFALASSVPPSMKAAGVAPAEALRYD